MEDFVLKMSEVFGALSDPTRLRIIRMLASNMESDLCVVELAKKVGISQPALSQHIRILKNVGILDGNRKGFRVYYNINTDVLKNYKADVDKLFKMAFVKCPDWGKCSGHKRHISFRGVKR